MTSPADPTYAFVLGRAAGQSQSYVVSTGSWRGLVRSDGPPLATHSVVRLIGKGSARHVVEVMRDLEVIPPEVPVTDVPGAVGVLAFSLSVADPQQGVFAFPAAQRLYLQRGTDPLATAFVRACRFQDSQQEWGWLLEQLREGGALEVRGHPVELQGETVDRLRRHIGESVVSARSERVRETLSELRRLTGQAREQVDSDLKAIRAEVGKALKELEGRELTLSGARKAFDEQVQADKSEVARRRTTIRTLTAREKTLEDRVSQLLQAQEELRATDRERGDPRAALMALPALTREDEAVTHVLGVLQANGRESREDELPLAEQVVALHVAFKTAPFTVLTGPSGAGKTSLVQAYAGALGVQFTPVAVQPNWTSVQDLHGYLSPLDGAYRETPFFEALAYQAESRGPDAPVDLVLLDEINLAQVEFFLADYLSAFEVDRAVQLLGRTEAAGARLRETHSWLSDRGGRVRVPQSMLIAGTANQDHTTRSFSDKFRDRSSFLELRPPRMTFSANLIAQGPPPAPTRYVPRSAWQEWHRGEEMSGSLQAEVFQALERVTAALAHAHLAPSVRVLRGVAGFATQAAPLLAALDVPDAPARAADLAVACRLVHKYAAWHELQWQALGLDGEAVRRALAGALTDPRATRLVLGLAG